MTQFARAVRGRALLEEALVPSREGKKPCLHPLGEDRRGLKDTGRRGKMANLAGLPEGKAFQWFTHRKKK